MSTSTDPKQLSVVVGLQDRSFVTIIFEGGVPSDPEDDSGVKYESGPKINLKDREFFTGTSLISFHNNQSNVIL